DEVGAVCVEALLDQKVDLAEIDKSKVDGDLLGLFRFVRCHGPHDDTIPVPSMWMVTPTETTHFFRTFADRASGEVTGALRARPPPELVTERGELSWWASSGPGPQRQF